MYSVVVFLTLLISIVLSQNTRISIIDDNFYINGKKTYDTAQYDVVPGLLLNSRMIQGIFDDYNTSTVTDWIYPDTKKWDATRNVHEFVGNMSLWRSHNLLAFTVGLQGGRPTKKDQGAFDHPQPWHNSAFNFKNASLDPKYMERVNIILSEADKIGMVVIVQFFYGGQYEKFDNYKNGTLIYKSIDNIIAWLLKTPYKNILIDVANECSNSGWDDTILSSKGGNMSKTIKYVQKISNYSYPVGSCLGGGHVPPDDMIEVSDILLLHGNNQSPSKITEMINTVRANNNYKPTPILFTEDYDTNTNTPTNNMRSAIEGHASWGFMTECNQTDNGDYIRFYQCPPTAWNIDTNIKQNFFDAVKNYTKS